jgi:pimeloyl-ACP methyl ester carboxylesterase
MRSKPTVRLFAFLIACLTAYGVVSATRTDAAQVAASIEYAFIPRPHNLPADMQPLPGATLRFLSIKALDGYTMQAALWQAEAKPPSATTIFVQVHGSGANFTELPLRSIARAFSARGYAALTISTRQHDKHVNTDNFFDVRHDIEAAVATAKALGYKTIILEGHSLGTVQMEYYAATTWDPAVKGVILTGPFANLPWKSRNILIHDDETYKALADASVKALQAGHAADLLPMKMPYLGGAQTPVTAQHFLTYRDDRSSAADGTYWIRRIPYPILLARDQADGVVLPFEPYMLLSAAHAEGSLVPSIAYVIVPDTHPTSAAGHIFTDNTPALVDAVSHWLSGEHL